MSLSDAIRDHARTTPLAIALIQDEVRLSWADFNALVDRAAAGLQRAGLSLGDRGAFVAETRIEYVVAFLGAVRAGMTPVPLASGVSPDAIAAMIADACPVLVFADATHAMRLPAGLGAPVVTLDNSDAGTPWSDWLAPVGASPAEVEIAPEAAFNLIYSSGTTGAPKGIVHSHRMRAGQIAALAGLFGPGAVTLLSTPLYSNTTLITMLPALQAGGTLVLMRKFEASAWLALAQRQGVTHTMLVPVQYQRLLACPDFDATDLSSFQLKFCTSAPFSPALKAEVLERWTGGLLEFFGMTEGGGVCMLPAHLFPHKLHTVGMPAPGADIRIIDAAGIERAVGEIGEIVSHSEQTMLGYHNRPEATEAGRWRAADGRSFIRTGDLGRFDADGFLEIVGRKKDMIISGGFNVYPVDVEACLNAHPDVMESAVIGVADVRWGETPVGFVVCPKGADAEAIRLWANERLGSVQRLSAVTILVELPRNALGKVLKTALADLAPQ